jgi:hypothetical protein
MFFVLFRRLVKTHFGFHLAIPLLIVLALSAAFDWLVPLLQGNGLHWPAFRAHWFAQRGLELVGIYLSFLLVFTLSVKKAGEVRNARVDMLRDILPGSKRYFAIGAIPLPEWFEPNSQIYLSTIIEHQLIDPEFRYERVLLFYTSADWKALNVSYLDEHYAKAFAAIHKRLNIPLAYLEPADLREILLSLDERTLRALGWQRSAVAWLRRWIPKIPGAWTLRRKPDTVPYALIEKDKVERVILFSKESNTLTLSEICDPEKVEARQKFVRCIEAKIYQGERELKEEFKFANYLFPGGST